MAAVIDDANYHQPVNDGGHVHNFDHHRSSRCQLVCQQSIDKQGVGTGDVFLFFGLCRRVEDTAQGSRFVHGNPRPARPVGLAPD